MKKEGSSERKEEIKKERNLRGFVKLKKSQKSEKNSEVGGWVKSQLGFSLFLKFYLFL